MDNYKGSRRPKGWEVRVWVIFRANEDPLIDPNDPSSAIVDITLTKTKAERIAANVPGAYFMRYKATKQ